MVKITFYNLLRSKYKLDTMEVEAGSVQCILNQIMNIHPQINYDDLMQAVLFINKEKVMHLNRLNEVVKDGDEIVFTNFVGGG